jgi:hypothetical protein
MYPALITAAFFTGVLLDDVIQKANPTEIGKHFLFGFLAVLGLWALEVRGMPIVAWGLLVVPTTVFLATLTYVFLSPPPAKPFVPIPPPAPKPAPKEEPTVQLPDENTVCVELEFDPSNPKPAPLPSCDVGADGTIGMPGTVCPQAAPITPSCSTDLSRVSETTAPSATETLDSLLKSINPSLTPVTTCK